MIEDGFDAIAMVSLARIMAEEVSTRVGTDPSVLSQNDVLAAYATVTGGIAGTLLAVSNKALDRAIADMPRSKQGDLKQALATLIDLMAEGADNAFDAAKIGNN